MNDYSELKRRAERATAGPWYSIGPSYVGVYADTGEEDRPYAVIPEGYAGDAPDCHVADYAYIAAASPDVILALLTEIEQLRERADALEHDRQVLREIADGSHAMRHEIEAQMDRQFQQDYQTIQQLTAERDAALRANKPEGTANA
jgi:hypothetical protein